MIDKISLNNEMKKLFSAEVLECTVAGSGGTSSVYKVKITKEPHCVAVKVSSDITLLRRECDIIEYIKSRADIKLPRIYSISEDSVNPFLVMEYFDGVSANNERFLTGSAEIRERLAKNIAMNILKLHKVTGDKFGLMSEPKFDNWHDYYRPFAKNVLEQARALVRDGYIKPSVFDCLSMAFERYDDIFDQPISEPTLIHGDYWSANIIADDNANVIGVVDPFHSLWADREYELFALNAIHGDKIPVLEEYIKIKPVSKNFKVKSDFYFLFSEVYWVTILHHDNDDYLASIESQLRLNMAEYLKR